MPATDCILEHGTFPTSACPVDEPNILVQSLSISGTREKKEFKNAAGCITALRYVNPTLTLEYDAYISTEAGLADQHPGTAITSLNNYAATMHGYAPGDGVIVYEEFTRECTVDDLMKIKFTAVQYPHVL